MKPELTVVIPTFNEADIIEGSLRRVAGALNNLCAKTEIVIADDGADNLPSVVERCGSTFGFCTVRAMRNGKPVGKGESIRRAFMTSRGDIVGFIDVDFSVDPEYIHDVIREIRAGSDMCIASREGSRWKSGESRMTSFVATMFSFIHQNIIFSGYKPFRDTQCGFKFFRREIAMDLYTDLVARDGLVDLEILLKAAQRGYRIKELMVPRRNDREGKRKLSRILLSESLSLWRIFYTYRLSRFP